MTRIGDEEIREGVETLERDESKHGETTHAQTHDDMWMNMFLRDTRGNTLSHAVHVNKDEMCARRLQWIAINCERNQL